MAAITEKMGLNYDLDGTEVDYFSKLNENTLKIDAFLPLCVIEQIPLASLPVGPTDGEIYLVDSSTIYIRQQGTWYTFVLPCNMSFYDQTLQNFYVYDGTNILLDSGPGGVIDAANVGGQIEVYRDKINGIINFKTLLAGSGITITDNGDDLEIEALASGFPAGTSMLFMQAAAPVGWTLDATNNDRFVRISNTAGGGVSGTWTSFSHSHTHAHTHELDAGGWARVKIGNTDKLYTDTVSSGGTWASDSEMDGAGTTASDSFAGGARLDGDTGSASSNTTSTASLSHGSAQHSYINAIVCIKD